MKKFLKSLKELNLPEGKYAIFGSGPMGVRRLREVGDLDVIVTMDVYNDLKNRPDFKIGYRKKSGNEFLEKDGIEVYKDWHPEDWDIHKLIQEAETIDGFPFVKLEEVLKWKKLKQRDKDKEDINLIEEYLRSN